MLVPVAVVALAAASGCAAGSRIESTPPAPPIIDVRLASEQPAPGFAERRELDVADGPRAIYLASVSVITDADVTRARTRPQPSGLVLEITLADSTARRVHEVTANNIGKHMAVLLNGRMNGPPPRIMAGVRANRLSLALTLSPAAADSVRSLVAARWPEPVR